MNFLNALFGQKAQPKKLEQDYKPMSQPSVTRPKTPDQLFEETNTLNPVVEMTETYESIVKSEEINLENKIRDIFADKNTKPEKNNAMYVSEIMSMPNIAEIVNKTYVVNPDLDEESKRIHEHLRTSKLYKITKPLESHNHYFYKTGVNKFQGEFTHKVDCSYGGLYFGKGKDILRWLEWGIYVREVYLCPDSKIVGEDGLKYKTNKFILGARQLISRDFLNQFVHTEVGTSFTSNGGGILGYLLGQNNATSNSDSTSQKDEHPMSQVLSKLDKLFNSSIPPTYDEVLFTYRAFQDEKKPLFIILSSDSCWKDVIQMHILNLHQGPNSDTRYVSHVYHAFKFMHNPSESVQKLAVSLNPMCIEKIYNPSLDICKLAIDRYPKFMSNLMDQQICDELATDLQTRGMFYNLHYLKKINDFHQEYLISRSPLFLMLLANPTENVLEICQNYDTTLPYINMYKNSISLYLRDDTELVMTNRLISYLTVYFDTHTQKFLDQLTAYGGYMSGSFACNALYGTKYDCSDIDIYFNNYASAINFGDALKDYEYLRTGCVKYDQYSILGAHIDRIITHKVIGPRSSLMPKIQLIVINRNVNPVNYIMTYFDINHCKVAIDGTCNFYSYDFPTQLEDSGTNNIATNVSDHIFNVFNLFKASIEMYRECNSNEKTKYFISLLISMRAYIKKVYERIEKYKKRGVVFDETNIKLFDELVNSVKSTIVVNIDTQENTLNFNQNIDSQVVVPTLVLPPITIVPNSITNNNNNDNNNNTNVDNSHDYDSYEYDEIERLTSGVADPQDLLDFGQHENNCLTDLQHIDSHNVTNTSEEFVPLKNINELNSEILVDSGTYICHNTSSDNNVNLIDIISEVFSFEPQKEKLD